jgi:hypothetical protein
MVTVTMSPHSAQCACTLGGCQLPRLIFDCPGLQNGPGPPKDGLRFRPSFLLCPVDSVDAGGSFGIDRIEIGQDNEKLTENQNRFDMTKTMPCAEWAHDGSGTQSTTLAGSFALCE